MLYLRPGDYTIVRIRYGYVNPQCGVVWAGRGKHWVTEIIYGAKFWAVVIKVVNITHRVEQLLYENTVSTQLRKRERWLEELAESMAPPRADHPEYDWPTKLLLRPLPGKDKVRTTALHPSPGCVRPESNGPILTSTSTAATQTCDMKDACAQTEAVDQYDAEEPSHGSDAAGATESVGITKPTLEVNQADLVTMINWTTGS
ncbi:hypothetical protein C6341_g12823 [Phytophthora cactorum]|nr:hypothetical protein C6341_g12823 [Phytophthora cactorum]